MNSKTAQHLLRFTHPDQLADRGIQKAIVAAGNADNWKAEFTTQTQTDKCISAALDELSLQADDLKSLASTRALFSGKANKIHLSLRDPTVLGVLFAILLLTGFFIWFFLTSIDRIQGEERLLDLVKAGATEDVQQFDEVDTTLGTLDDWFTLNGVSDIWIPEKFLSKKVLAARTFTHRGNNIACALLPENQILVYIFRGAPQGIKAPDEDKWYYANNSKESIGLIEHDGVCFVVVIRGKLQELKNALR
ncbi:MAG: hypothetical protein ACK5LK_07755 [Chthoniobacterales bacterium]